MLGDNPWTSLLWMLVCVTLITGLAYWFTKNVLGRQNFGRNENFSVLSSFPVGKNQRIALIRAGERYFLLEIAEQNITKLAELSKEEAACWEQKQQEDRPTFGQAFREQMDKKLRGEKK